MNLNDLSLKHRIALCRRAAMAVVARLKALAGRVDPGDEPLLRLFGNLVRDEEDHLAAMSRFDERVESAAPTTVEQKDLDEIVARSIPSLSRTLAEGFIDREAGTYLVECLQAESACLYRTLAEQAPDEQSRAFFLDAKEAEELNIEFMRQVLL